MKKLISVFLAAIMIFSLASCSATPKNQTALTVEGTDINSEIFAYFLSKVSARPADYSLDSDASKDEICDAAIRACKIYLITNTLFSEMKLSLSSVEKAAISEKVNNLWFTGKDHYESIGVSKQTLLKVITCEEYEDAVFTAKYDAGTDNASAEHEVKNYFYSNYLSFLAVCAYFTADDGITPLSQLEKTELITNFESLSNALTTSEKFSEKVEAIGFSASSSIILKKGSDGYPEGFYEKVAAQDELSVQVITFDDCIFAVFKEDLAEKGDGLYAEYRSACISDLYYDEYEQLILNRLDGMKVKENPEVIEEICNRIIK